VSIAGIESSIEVVVAPEVWAAAAEEARASLEPVLGSSAGSAAGAAKLLDMVCEHVCRLLHAGCGAGVGRSAAALGALRAGVAA
jgi:hypothetical protein